MAFKNGCWNQNLSANCRGIRNKVKRYDVIYYMKDKKLNILCLQDRQLTIEDEVDLRIYWKGEILQRGAHTNSREVARLLSDTFEYKVKNVIRDNSGNMIVLIFK